MKCVIYLGPDGPESAKMQAARGVHPRFSEPAAHWFESRGHRRVLRLAQYERNLLVAEPRSFYPLVLGW